MMNSGRNKDDDFEEIRTRVTLLVKLTSGSNETAWLHFYELYQGVILGMARRWGLQEATARDVVQDVMLAVSRNAHAFSYDATRRIFSATTTKPGENPKYQGGFRQWLFTVTKRAIWKYRYSHRHQREIAVSDLNSQRDEDSWRRFHEQAAVAPDSAPDAQMDEKTQKIYQLSLLEQAIRLLPDCMKRSHPRKIAIFLALKQPHVLDAMVKMENPPLPSEHMQECRQLHRVKQTGGEITKNDVMQHYGMSSNHVDQEVKAVKTKLAAVFSDLRAGRDPCGE